MGNLMIRVGGQSIPIPRGPRGQQGPTGPSGPANSLSIGTVTTGAAGTQAVADITGAPPNQTLDLTIPRGDTGSVNNHTHPPSDITPGVLDDMAFGSYSEVLTTLTSAVTTTLDCSLGQSFVVNQTMNTTLAISNVDQTAGRTSSVSLVLKQDATGGRSVTWPTGTKWPLGVAPTLTTTANAINVVTFMTIDGGTTWLGFLAGAGMA